MKFRIKENYFFLGLLCLIFAFGMYGLIKTPNLISVSENRALNQFQHFTIQTFLDGTFQDNFENAFSDQFAKSEKIRTAYGELVGKLPTFGIDKAICSNRYIKIYDDTVTQYAIYDCDDHMLNLPIYPDDTKIEILKDNIAKFNHVNQLTNAYYYIINTSSTYDFENNRKIIDYKDILSEKLQGKYKISSLKYDGYDEYKNLFYKTDHHWNYKGSYQGFLDILEMMNIEDTTHPQGTFTNHEYFFGSLARTARNYTYLDEFTIYIFDIPQHSITINGEAGLSYNHLDDFINHNYDYSRSTSFYAQFYGTDYAEIIFDFHQPEEKNLLIIADSFSNPINELIAQYFNKTYVIDIRCYEKFILSKYLQENNIDKTLFIMSSDNFLTATITTKGLEL